MLKKTEKQIQKIIKAYIQLMEARRYYHLPPEVMFPRQIFYHMPAEWTREIFQLELKKLLEKGDLLEKLARSEHLQWQRWSKNLKRTEQISKERKQRWRKLWTTYQKLPEEAKEKDRAEARVTLKLLLKESLRK